MQQINGSEWISKCGEWSVLTDGVVRIYNLDDLIFTYEDDFLKCDSKCVAILPDEIQLFLGNLK